MTRTFNPFLQANFNPDQLAYAQSDHMNSLKIPKEAPNPNRSPSFNRINFAGYEFFPESLQMVQEQISDLRGHFDLPFDELYHKEKYLVDRIIKATQALQKKEAELPNPMGPERTFSLNELKGEYMQDELQAEHPYVKSQRKRSKHHSH